MQTLRTDLERRHVAETERFAAEVFGDAAQAHDWMRRPNRTLDGATPLVVAAESEEGAKRVTAILGRIRHGIPS